MTINRIELDSYKRIDLVNIDISSLNVIVGENNSGKSSVLQGIHYHLVSAIARSEAGTDTFINSQIMYQPSQNFLHLRNGNPYGNSRDADNSSKLTLSGIHIDGQTFEYAIELRKGRNDDNITCTTAGDQRVAQAVVNRSLPFSILVPGLAGIPVKEEFRSKSVVLKSIPSGDANLYLRNILLLLRNIGKLEQVNEYLGRVFDGFCVSVDFNTETDQYINSFLYDGKHLTPLELVGTGVLQAIQIFAYIVLFQPKLLLLDEPDSHLHPNNQKKLALVLSQITEVFDTKMIISTHSKHIIDTFIGRAEFIRLKEGKKIEQGPNLERLSMLIDIGALDEYDKLRNGLINRVYLTEDSSKEYLKILLLANSIDLEESLIVSYKSCSNLSAAIVLIEFIKEISETTNVIIHRDRDFMIDAEAEIYSTSIATNGGKAFITKYSDIESYFCQKEHLAMLLQEDIITTETWINELSKANHIMLQHEFTRKRDEVKNLLRSKIEAFPSTEELLGDTIPLSFDKCKGKSLIKLIRSNMHSRFSRIVELKTISDYLIDENLAP